MQQVAGADTPALTLRVNELMAEAAKAGGAAPDSLPAAYTPPAASGNV